MTVSARFAVGFTDRTWITSGPFRGDGENIDAAGADALGKCAANQARFRKEVAFITFTGLREIGSRARIFSGESA